MGSEILVYVFEFKKRIVLIAPYVADKVRDMKSPVTGCDFGSMNVIKKPFQSALISLIQMFIICIPLAMAGSHFLQVKGIYLSIAVSYFLGGLISVLILYKYLKDFFQNEFSPALKLN